jgi:hypothetical protein
MIARHWRLVASAVFIASALTGCVVEEHRNVNGYGNGAATGTGGYGSGLPALSIPICPSAATAAGAVSIDTGSELTTPAGQGTGVLVEYKAGGHWHIFTACDTTITGFSCAYDVTAQAPGGTVSNISGDNLESGDLVGSGCTDTAYLSVNTSTDFDGMLFDAPPGSPVRVTVALDGAIYPDVIYWVTGGVAHNDAHSNPLAITPTTP